MYVVKRNGQKQAVQTVKIVNRIARLAYGLDPDTCKPDLISSRLVNEALESGISTAELDRIAAEMAYSMRLVHPDYEILASRIAASNLQKECPKRSFSATVSMLQNHTLPGSEDLFVPAEILPFIRENAVKLDSAIVHDRDFSLKYMRLMDISDNELMRDSATTKPLERVQHYFMRKALVESAKPLEVTAVIETYNRLSQEGEMLPLVRMTSSSSSYVSDEELVYQVPAGEEEEKHTEEPCVTCSS